jgi:hypothetical protein
VVGKVHNPGTFTPGRYVNALEALPNSPIPAAPRSSGRPATSCLSCRCACRTRFAAT